MTRERGRSPLIQVALLLLAGLVAMEVGLRIHAWGRDDASTGPGLEMKRSGILRPSRHDEVIYEPKPGVQGILGNRLVHINDLGLRGRERQLEKPSGDFRIVGLGDSSMFGTGVAEGQTYLDLLERRLNGVAEGDRHYEALNFATPGFNTAQEVATFEHRALPFDPDLVVLHFVADDFALPRYLRDPSVSDGRSISHLVDLIGEVFAAGEEDEPAPPSLVRSTEASEELRGQLADTDYMLGREGAHRALEKLSRLAGERQVPVVFMMLGDFSARRAAARDTARELGFHYVNALPRFREHLVANGVELTKEAWRDAFFGRGELPSTLAHRVYADLLFDTLIDLGVVSPPASESWSGSPEGAGE